MKKSLFSLPRPILFLLFALCGLLFFAGKMPEGAPSANLKIAQQQFDAYQYEAAVGALNAALANRPNTATQAEIRFLLSKCRERMGALDSALQENTLALALLRRQPRLDSGVFVRALMGRSAIFAALYKPDSCMANAAKADTMAQNFPAAFRAEVKMQRGDAQLQEFYMINIMTAYSYYAEAMSLAEAGFGQEHSFTGCCQVRLGACQVFLGNIAVGDAAIDNGLKLAERPGSEPFDFQKNSAYRLAGVVRSEMGRPRKGLEYFQKAFAWVERAYRTRHPIYAASLSNIGNTYILQGEPENALPYFQAALRFSTGSPAGAGGILDNMGTCWLFLGKLDSARVCIERGLALRRKYGNPLSIANSCLNQSRVCGYAEDCPAAIRAAQEAIQIYDEQKVPPNSEEYESALNNIAGCWVKSFKPDSARAARPVFEKNLGSWRKRFPKGDFRLVQCLQNIGDTYFVEQQYDSAFAHYDLAMAEVGFTGLEGDTDKLPQNLWWAATTVGHTVEFELKLAQEKNDVGLGKKTFLRCQNTIKLIDRARRDGITAEGVRQSEQPIAAAMLEVMCGVAIFLRKTTGSDAYIRETFRVAEQMKGYRAFRNLSDAEALENFFSEDVITRDRLLQDSVSAASVNLTVALQNKYGVSAARANRERAMLAYRAFRDGLDAASPAFRQQRGLMPPASAEEVQTGLLGDGQALVEFVLGLKTSHVFVVTRHGIWLRSIPSEISKIEKLARDVTQGTCAEVPDNARDRRYKDAAYQLYQRLFGGMDDLLPNGTRLIIIPDGVLATVPFGALLCEKVAEGQDNWGNYAYMAKRHAISSGLSASLLLRDRQSPQRNGSNGQMLAMAPFSDNDQLARFHLDSSSIRGDYEFGALPKSKSEINLLAEVFSREDPFLLGEKATLSKFRELAPASRYLHIATHSAVDLFTGQNSFLVFSEAFTQEAKQMAGLLTAREVYSMKLMAEMTVLTACETAAGTIEDGEGSISFCRAFTFGGSRSVVAALWKLSDATAPGVIGAFYQKLLGKNPKTNNALPKDMALQEAQLSYLRENRSNACRPYYWACLTLFGNFDPLPPQRP